MKHEPLDPQEVTTLATYNAERGRGIVHTMEWQAKMDVLQRRFNEIGYQTEKRYGRKRRTFLRDDKP